MQRGTSKRASVLPTLLVVSVLLLAFGPIQVRADDPTLVQVSPSAKTVSSSQTFTLDVSCTPGQPMKSFEFKLSFDPTLLQVNAVTEGTIFSGYNTFFSNGTIDNDAGTIINIYDLIVGAGNVSSFGTLATVTFTSYSLSGTSLIDLYDVGVTDELGYLTIAVSDGSVTVIGENQPPSYSSISPSNRSTGVPLDTSSLGVLIQDPEGDDFDWSISTSPDIGSANGTVASNGTKTCTISGLSYSTTYHWYVASKDTGSDHWRNASYWFTTAAEPPGENPPPPGGGDENPPQPPSNETPQNTPPLAPSQPIGPLFIQRGVQYEYRTTASDPDSDRIRVRFDWGDGTFSDWSDLINTNSTTAFSHYWDEASVFSIRAFAQDEHGLNSSWSTPLSVTVSQTDENESAPLLNIVAPGNGTVGHTVHFDASVDADPFTVIISYEWEFGDGQIGSGKTIDHTYEHSGQYTVLLTITDGNGKTYTKTMPIMIEAEPTAVLNLPSIPLIYLVSLIALLSSSIGLGILLYSRKKLKKVISVRLADRQARKLESLDGKISDQHERMRKISKDKASDDRKISKLLDHSVEDEVDRKLMSLIEQEVDKIDSIEEQVDRFITNNEKNCK